MFRFRRGAWAGRGVSGRLRAAGVRGGGFGVAVDIERELAGADVVDAANLRRQIVHATSRIGQPKVDSAEKQLTDLNPDVKIVKFQERLLSDN